MSYTNNTVYYLYPNEDGENVFEFLPESHLIGLHTQFLDDLSAFNRNYHTDLAVKKTFHWKNGTYDKIREKTVKYILPNLHNKPRGSYNITQHNTHRYTGFRNELLRLENEMSNKRWNRYTMGDETDDGFPKWNARLTKFEEMISNFRHVDKMEIPNISRQFFGRKYRYMHTDANHGLDWWDTSDVNPRIRFTFHLKDIYLQIFHGSYILSVIPWGDLVVHLEMDIYWWANTLGNNAARDRMAGRWNSNKLFTPYVLQYPHYTGLEHPFIKQNMDSYSSGNCCFGNYTNDIAMALHKFDFNRLYSELVQWASVYTLGRTSPLNQYHQCIIGKKQEYLLSVGDAPVTEQRKRLYKDHFKVNAERCDAVWEHHYNKDSEAFVEDHCNKCDLSGVIEDSEGTCVKYIEKYSPDAIDWRELVINVLMDGFGINQTDFYTSDGGPVYFGLRIDELSRRWKRRTWVADGSEAQEILFAAEVERAQLIHKFGIVCNWKRRRTDYNIMVTRQEGDWQSERNAMWTRDLSEYSNEFLILLINKQERLNSENEERRL